MRSRALSLHTVARSNIKFRIKKKKKNGRAIVERFWEFRSSGSDVKKNEKKINQKERGEGAEREVAARKKEDVKE